MQKIRPDLIILENVQQFDVPFFETIIPADYNIRRVCTSPVTVGVPAAGDRLFLEATPSTTVCLETPFFGFHKECFENMFRRQLACDASIFLCATRQERREWHNRMCRLRGIGLLRDRYRFEDIISTSARVRLHALRKRADERPPEKAGRRFFNIAQTWASALCAAGYCHAL